MREVEEMEVGAYFRGGKGRTKETVVGRGKNKIRETEIW